MAKLNLKIDFSQVAQQFRGLQGRHPGLWPAVPRGARFNAATRDGADMSQYSHLLTEAIRSMIDVDEERDVDSLFSPGRTTALVQTIAGLDDFELIAFLAIVEAIPVSPTCRTSRS